MRVVVSTSSHQAWDLISLKEIHSINNVSQSWIRALAYEKRAVRTKKNHISTYSAFMHIIIIHQYLHTETSIHCCVRHMYRCAGVYNTFAHCRTICTALRTTDYTSGGPATRSTLSMNLRPSSEQFTLSLSPASSW